MKQVSSIDDVIVALRTCVTEEDPSKILLKIKWADRKMSGKPLYHKADTAKVIWDVLHFLMAEQALAEIANARTNDAR